VIQGKLERKLGWGGFDDALPPERVSGWGGAGCWQWRLMAGRTGSELHSCVCAHALSTLSCCCHLLLCTAHDR
jgi:hypothetical protein